MQDGCNMMINTCKIEISLFLHYQNITENTENNLLLKIHIDTHTTIFIFNNHSMLLNYLSRSSYPTIENNTRQTYNHITIFIIHIILRYLPT